MLVRRCCPRGVFQETLNTVAVHNVSGYAFTYSHVFTVKKAWEWWQPHLSRTHHGRIRKGQHRRCLFNGMRISPAMISPVRRMPQYWATSTLEDLKKKRILYNFCKYLDLLLHRCDESVSSFNTG